MPLLDRDYLADATGSEDFRDEKLYRNAYLASVFSAVQDEIGAFLKWQPALSYHQAEVGNTTLVSEGIYTGRYDIELKNKPLTSDLAVDAILSLQLTYPLALAVPTQVSLQFCSLFRHTGQLYSLAPGAVEALAGVSFGYGGPNPSVYAAGYLATYYAGMATGIDDPTPNGGGSGATFQAFVYQGIVTGITVLTPGSGYTNAPVLVISNPPLSTGTAQAGGFNSITLKNTDTAQDQFYTNDQITITGGTGINQIATIVNYNAFTKVATIQAPWATQPDATSTYLIAVPVTNNSGSGAYAVANLDDTGAVVSATIIAQGQGYFAAPAVTVSTKTSFNARPLLEDIREAAVLLARERIAFDNARNLNPNNPMSGFLVSQTSADASERYALTIRESSQSGTILGVGAGTPMGQEAQRKLSKHIKQRTPAFLGR